MSNSIPGADLIKEVCHELHALLRSLRPDEWHLPTMSSKRCVHDIAAHLLDGSLRRLSGQRDSYAPPGESGPQQGESLVDYLNRLNGIWEQATRSLSPRVLIDWLEVADRQYVEFLASLAPDETAIFSVAWAGEETSPNWFDVAREFTEKWHHTQQIFEATGRPSTIMTSRLYRPCLETLVRALPFTFREVDAPLGTTVTLEVAGDAGGQWQILRRADRWIADQPPAAMPTAKVKVPPEHAWKIFMKRRTADQVLQAFSGVELDGDQQLCKRVLEMVSVMA